MEAIAEQKGGIIKQGVPLVTGHIVPEALAVIEQDLKAKQAPRFAYGEDYQVSHHESVGRAKSLTIQVLLDKVAFRQDCWVCTR